MLVGNSVKYGKVNILYKQQPGAARIEKDKKKKE